MNAIEIRNLNKKFKGFALDNVSISLPTGCIMGLIGENGAGKTTVIKSVLGIIRPDGGEIRLFGKVPDAEMKNDIGVVLDEVGIPAQFNIRNVDSIMKNSFTKWNSDVFYDYIKRFNLPDKKEFKTFSKGMKMKLGIAVALSHDAKLLILDEPTSGLDPLVRDEIIDIFNDYTRDENHSILISSHIVSDLEKICDYITFIHNGKITLCEEKDILLEKYGFVNTSEEVLARLDRSAVKGKKPHKFGTEAVVVRDKIPSNLDVKPVTIEELFVYMSKEEK